MGTVLVTEAVSALSGVGGTLSKEWTNLFGGASRDKQRQAEADGYGKSALAGSVTAARYVLGGQANTASHEKPMYDAWVNTLSLQAPAILAQARALGQLWAGSPVSVGDGGVSVIQTDLQKLGTQLQTDAAKAIQQAGSQVVSALTGAVAPAGSAQSQPVTIPTNMTTIVLVIAGVIVLLFLARSGGRRGG